MYSSEDLKLLDILVRAVTDTGYWSWWSADFPAAFQLEFGGTQLYVPPTLKEKPASGLIAFYFPEPISVTFLTFENGLSENWKDLLHHDQMKPMNLSYDEFAFNNEKLCKKLLESSLKTDTVHGCAPLTTEFNRADVRLGFSAGKAGMLIASNELKLKTHHGEILLPQVIDMNKKWWAYWKDYWDYKNDNALKLPYDPTCEVTIPISTPVDKETLLPGAKKTTSAPVVKYDSGGILCSFSNGTVQRMPWMELKAVLIETNDQGPFLEDVYFILFGNSKDYFCAIPQGAEGSSELLTRLQELPGFDNEAVIKAMSCASNASFLCWEKEGWIGENWQGIIDARNYRKK